jgi:hypothetical protein
MYTIVRDHHRPSALVWPFTFSYFGDALMLARGMAQTNPYRSWSVCRGTWEVVRIERRVVESGQREREAA